MHLPGRFWRVAPQPGLEAELAGLGWSDWEKSREREREGEGRRERESNCVSW